MAGPLPIRVSPCCCFADGGIIRGVRHIHHERDVRLQRIRNLPRAEQTDFLLHIRYGTNLGVELRAGFLQQTQRFGHRKGADAIVKRASHCKIAAQNIKFIHERDGVADAHEFLSIGPR
jgi:hypothetical protein